MTEDTLMAVRWWVGNSRKWVTEFLTEAPANASIIAVVGTGSAVRDGAHRRSDLDLLLLYRGTRPAISAPVEVDVRSFAADAIEAKVAVGNEVLCWALRYGRPLYDPQGFWRRLSSSWSQRLPLPSAQEARERGTQSLNRANDMLLIGDESAADDLILAALTQFVRERLIGNGIFPASRPELPGQLRAIASDDPLAQLLDDAMYKELGARELFARLKDALPFSYAESAGRK